MAALVLLNGPPGVGKSTLARRFVADHPLALALDIDVVRSMLGRWMDAPTDAGLAARALAMAMIRTHLAAGHDVVVPQFLGRVDFVVELAAVAASERVPFVELARPATIEVPVVRDDVETTYRAVLAALRSGGWSPT